MSGEPSEDRTNGIDTGTTSEHRPRPLVDIVVSIVIPSLILMKASGDERLGAAGALVVALAFPMGWGLYEYRRHGARNLVALLGVVSVLLTGGIGLLRIDAQWLAVKEAAIPLAIGIGVFVASRLGYPLIRKLVLNPSVMNVERIESALAARGGRERFERRLDQANLALAGTFLFSAIMNFILARAIVTSESGTAAFNEELGRLTLLSYPIIAIPSMIMMLGIIWFTWRTLSRLTGLGLEDMLASSDAPEADSGERRPPTSNRT